MNGDSRSAPPVAQSMQAGDVPLRQAVHARLWMHDRLTRPNVEPILLQAHPVQTARILLGAVGWTKCPDRTAASRNPFARPGRGRSISEPQAWVAVGAVLGRLPCSLVFEAAVVNGAALPAPELLQRSNPRTPPL